MSGDLSLSGALGGLRIANPDEDAALSPASPTAPDPRPTASTRPLPPSSHSSGDTITQLQHPALLPVLSHTSTAQDSDGLGFNPDSYTVRDGGSSPATSQDSRSPPIPNNDAGSRTRRLGHRESLPLTHQGQQQMQYPIHSSNVNQQMRNPSAPQNTSVRPISGMYQQSNTSSSSQSSYRYRDELGSSHSGSVALERNGSTAARAVTGGPVPQRESSRSYRLPGQQPNGGNGPLPPRRNSRRHRAPTNGSAADYETTNAYSGPAPQASQAPQASTADEWRAVSTRQETDSNGQVQTRVVKKGPKDFNFGRTLGEGSYSTVLAATDRQNLKEYAIKVLDKRHIIKEKKVKYVNIERDTLNRLTEHPGIVRLYYTFQDERSLYYVLDLASGGELLGVLKKMGSFDIECTQFYGAQILDSVAYMHSRGVIHRDLKPENVLLDRNMHTKITDFGTAKLLRDPAANGGEGVPGSPTDGADNDRANSFVGTAEYVSPELLNRSNACKASDLWAFGCIIYQLLAGRPPFKAANEYLTFQKILNLEYSFPDNFPPAARDLVERLLVLEPANRLPVEHIKNHEFFDGITWGKILWREKPPQLKPYVPPAAAPIKLNGTNDAIGAASAAYAAHQNQMSTSQGHIQQQRPQLRGVTDLPPPSQLDIDWSPVLTHNNERILKLGNLIVCTSQQEKSPNGKNGEPPTPSDKPKFRGFFGSKEGKKRERLVLITSSARLLVAAAGGNDKKAKMEFNCLTSGTSWKAFVDGKGLTAFQLDTRDKHVTFEDPRATTSDPAGSKYSTQEWLDALENAKDIALAMSTTGSYSGESFLNNVDSSVSSPADSLGGDAAMPMSGPSVERHHMRHTLRKNTDEGGEGFTKGRKRFSKRHSKSGLAAVF